MFPGNLALVFPRGRVPPASQVPGLCHGGQRAGSSPVLRPGSANTIPESPGANPWGPAISPAPPDCTFILVWLWDLHAQHRQEQEKPVASRICFPHPQGCKHPAVGRRWGGWCSSCFWQKETQTQADVQGRVWPACSLPPAPVPQLDSALVWGQCHMSPQWLVPPMPWPRGQKMNSGTAGPEQLL